MSDWSLSQLFASLHEDIQLRLGTARKAFHHPGAKGDASEGVWIEMLDTYLPKRYQAANAFVVDSLGNFSDQIDVVVFDRQYSPFIFKFNDPHAGGTYPAKPLIPILGGLLTFESDWSPALGASFDKALNGDLSDGRLDMGCVASHGHFYFNNIDGKFNFEPGNKPATAFLFRLIAQLQFSGTVPMIDIDAYGKWLAN